MDRYPSTREGPSPLRSDAYVLISRKEIQECSGHAGSLWNIQKNSFFGNHWKFHCPFYPLITGVFKKNPGKFHLG